MYTLAVWYFVLSLVAFAMFGWDKSSARHGRYRTDERQLFAVSLLGGWPGIYLGRHLFRHKTRKPGFGTKLLFLSAANITIMAGIWFYIPGLFAGYFPTTFL